MLAAVDARVMLDRLPHARATPRRRRLRTHRTNISEMLRLLRPHGITLGRRLRGWPPADGAALLRVHHAIGSRNWHYAVLAAGRVFDPSGASDVPAVDYFAGIDVRRVFYYEIDAR